MTPVRRILIGLVATLVVSFAASVTAQGSVATSPDVVHAYAYDSDHHTAPPINATTERAPPEPYGRPTTYDAVDRWSNGDSALPRATTPTTSTYNDRKPPVLVAVGAPAPGLVRVTAAALSSFVPWHVAAKTTTGAESALSGARLSTHLRQLEK